MLPSQVLGSVPCSRAPRKCCRIYQAPTPAHIRIIGAETDSNLGATGLHTALVTLQKNEVHFAVSHVAERN